MPHDLTAALDAVIDKALSDQRIVGAHVLVARDGASAYARDAGLADREAGRPMAPDTLLRLSSLTKPIVTAAVLALVEAGAIRLEDTVDRFLPAFRPKFGGAAPLITIRQLLTHTSGLSTASCSRRTGPTWRSGSPTAWTSRAWASTRNWPW
jgi:CubicO group peptidase (beta-lactamase class C family)